VSAREPHGDRLAFHELLLEHTEDAIVAIDREWLITGWNKGAERVYGWSAEEALGRHVPTFVRMDLNREERAELRRELAECGRWRGEATVERKDGSTVSVEVITVAVHDSGGELTGFLGIHRDISERKPVDQALRAAQERSETILQSITDAVVAMDREWRFTYINDRAMAQTRKVIPDVTADDLLGKSIWEISPGLVGTTIYNEFHRALREQAVVEFEAYSAPGRRWVEIRVYPSESGVSVYSHDISPRKAAQEEMSRRGEQQALVAVLGQRALATEDLQPVLDEAVALVARTLGVELAGVAEITRGGEGVIFRAGFGWRDGVVGRRIDQVERDSLVGYTMRQRYPVVVEDMATDRRFTPSASAIAMDHGVVSALGVMIASPDSPFGVLATLSTRRRAFSSSDVSFVRAVANVLAGAVERSRAQERLAEVRQAERNRIARDLHDAALQELTDALVQAGRARAAGLAPDAAAHLVSTLKRVSAQLRNAIHDLRQADESRPFPDALRALVDAQRALAIDCEIHLDIAQRTPIGMLGDRGTELLRIVGEALTNARRHSGARRVRVSARASARGLCLEVTDDGRGFDPADERSRTEGNGIQGMRERAALLGGELDIRSAPGTGTTVSVELASARPDEPPRAPARILLVEDHAAVRDAVADMFEDEPDLDVVARAASLADARGMLHDIDLAILDLGLPDGYGADLIADLHHVNPRAQALVLSATLDPDEITRATSSGAAATLDKIADLPDLVDVVRRLHRGTAPSS
jgi:PAS domain S-box-containing protein